MFLYPWLCWVSVAARAPPCAEWGPLSSRGGLASRCSGLSSCRSQALGHPDFSSCSMWAQQLRSWAPEHRLRSCGSQAERSCSMWDPPDRGSNPCLLHWQADSLPLSHQGSPTVSFLERLMCGLGFPGLANENTGYSVTLEF